MPTPQELLPVVRRCSSVQEREAGIQILERDEGAPRGWSPQPQPDLHLP